MKPVCNGAVRRRRRDRFTLQNDFTSCGLRHPFLLFRSSASTATGATVMFVAHRVVSVGAAAAAAGADPTSWEPAAAGCRRAGGRPRGSAGGGQRPGNPSRVHRVLRIRSPARGAGACPALGFASGGEERSRALAAAAAALPSTAVFYPFFFNLSIYLSIL